AIDGIQNQRGLDTAVSKSVPDWSRDGVVPRLPSWYQRAAERVPLAPAVPEESTRMLWAVQRVGVPVGSRPVIASNMRSSSASSPPVVPWAGTENGLGAKVVGTVTVLADIDGVPPGSLILRMSRRLKNEASGPTT